MKLSRLAVPATAALLCSVGFAGPADAAPRAGLHCAGYQSTDKVELSGDQKSYYVGSGVTSVCIKAGAAAFENQPVVGGWITSPNGKGISYYVPTEYCEGQYCEPSNPS